MKIALTGDKENNADTATDCTEQKIATDLQPTRKT
jgi:hypothetical protein